MSTKTHKHDRYGPLNKLYVKRITETIDKALEHYPRLLAVRVDLRFPDEEDRVDCPTRYYAGSDVISLFFNSLDAQVEEDINRKVKAGKTTLTCDLRYVWVRELNKEKTKHHYHVLLLLNKDAYLWPGRRETSFDRSTLYQMLIRAWVRAVNRANGEETYHGLIHIPYQGYYQLNRNKPDFKADYEELTERAMYLAKEHSKDKSDGRRNFGCSQR
ncbi:inovirus Gp2 family protein [Serratia fonticola]|uniref:inovirus Gp2 family protein n=1 Tax=Serratia fonticola TaxID=47917 RepID=UPI002DB96AE9|nr:inovirus Gp2 family protein [Serratia fonticola]MEB7886244.1 inovirus Gp2 family protein [Serratia fonticola]